MLLWLLITSEIKFMAQVIGLSTHHRGRSQIISIGTFEESITIFTSQCGGHLARSPSKKTSFSSITSNQSNNYRKFLFRFCASMAWPKTPKTNSWQSWRRISSPYRSNKEPGEAIKVPIQSISLKILREVFPSSVKSNSTSLKNVTTRESPASSKLLWHRLSIWSRLRIGFSTAQIPKKWPVQ